MKKREVFEWSQYFHKPALVIVRNLKSERHIGVFIGIQRFQYRVSHCSERSTVVDVSENLISSQPDFLPKYGTSSQYASEIVTLCHYSNPFVSDVICCSLVPLVLFFQHFDLDEKGLYKCSVVCTHVK